MSEDAFRLPEDLTGISDEELASLHERATNEFDALYEGGATNESLARAAELADAIEALSGERTTRAEAAKATAEQFEATRQRVEAARAQAQPDPEPESEPAPEPEVAESATPEPALVADARPKTDVRDVIKSGRPHLNVRLSDAAKNAPDPQVPDNRADDLVITASAATSGHPIGTRITDLDGLARFIGQHSKSLTVTHGSPSYTPFATIQRPQVTVLGENTHPAEVERILNELTDPSVLTAAGGWCAPSEIRYDFFNIACQERTAVIDLPTVGIDRGGIKWPVAPSLADVFSSPAAFAPFGATFNVQSVPWLWTESDDIAAATGSPTKPCIRVPCSSFGEARLECYGYCVTAGNLTDSAFPEATANFLKLVMAAQIRAENFRYLAQMVSGSTNVGAIGTAGAGTTAPLLGAVELAAIDYRTKYGMCDDDVLEVVLPTWTKGVVRSDLAKRNGLALFDVTDAMIAAWFDVRSVRVQFVGEYQVRGSGLPGQSSAITAWPTSLEFMIYAAGTWVRGDGMSLDLGVVRDSTLNSTNDHTAAWTESCHLVAKFGHESRRYQVAICTDGTTGAADLTACGV
ncbi:MAG TPA: major capsid protein [Micromonosporaceae bacterium]|nr:major capsid protein [Micromonosporaceae bacterium]